MSYKNASSLYWLITKTQPALDSPELLLRRSRSPLYSTANLWNWWVLCCLFSCKCVQIENIVHQRGPPSLLRHIALAFLLFPWERCSLSSVTSLSHSRLPFPFWQTAWRNGQNWLIEQAFHGQWEKEREMFCRCLPQISLAHVLVFFFLPSEHELFCTRK